MVKFTDEMKTTGFSLIPEGRTFLRVEEVKAVKQLGLVDAYKVKLKDKAGRVIVNTYRVSPKTNKEYYIVAMRSFYSLLTTGCGLVAGEDGEIDEQEAVGKYLIANIKHTEGKDGRKFQNLGYIEGHAVSFDKTEDEYYDEMDDTEDPYA